MTKGEKKAKIGAYIFILIVNIVTVAICVVTITLYGIVSGIGFCLTVGVGIFALYLGYKNTCKILDTIKIKTKEFIDMIQEI